MKIYRLLLLLLTLAWTAAMKAEVAYRNNHIRITVIDEGTLRLEYAPDGKFVDKKSFLAVNRDYDKVTYQLKENGKTVTLTTQLLKLVYRKSEGPFTAQNLTITSTKAISKSFVWKPGMKQEGNLKGTYRTLDGYNGEFLRYENNRPMPL